MPPHRTIESTRLSSPAVDILASQLINANSGIRVDQTISESDFVRYIGGIGLSDAARHHIEAFSFTEIMSAMRAVQAGKDMMARWTARGGSASAFGLPLKKNPRAETIGGQYVIPFRGGNLRIDPAHLNRVIEEPAPPTRLTFEGLILHSRQETSRDEIYGQAGYRLGSIIEGDRVRSFTFTIPEVSLGGRNQRNTRVWKTSQQIYQGPPTGMELFVALAEHDSGDRSVLRNKVKQAIEASSQSVMAALGAPGGAASLGFLGKSASRSMLENAVVEIASWFVLEVFGIGDDPYNPGAMTIPWSEMKTPPPLQVAGHAHDNKVIEYTHKIDMSGTDDAGAVGNISAYFRVWR